MSEESTQGKKVKKTTKKNADSLEKLELIREFADDMKAIDIEVIDIRDKTSVADYFVICTGSSDVHARSIAEKVAEKLRDVGIKPFRQSGGGEASGWYLYDYGDVVFHVFLDEKRQFYDLESLWKNMPIDPNVIQEPSK